MGSVLGSVCWRPWGTESVCVVLTLLPLRVALGRMTRRQGRLWGHEFGGDTELLRPAGSRSGKPLLPDLGLRAPCGQGARTPGWPAARPGAPVARLPPPPPVPWARGAGRLPGEAPRPRLEGRVLAGGLQGGCRLGSCHVARPACAIPGSRRAPAAGSCAPPSGVLARGCWLLTPDVSDPSPLRTLSWGTQSSSGLWSVL